MNARKASLCVWAWPGCWLLLIGSMILNCTSVLTAATVTWDDGAATDLWSSTSPDNWSITGVPGSSDVATFANTGAAVAAGTVTNIVDTTFTVQGVNYTNTGANFHTTQINSGRVLSIVGGSLGSGLNIAGSNGSTDANTINGPGTLEIGGGSTSAISVGHKTISSSSAFNSSLKINSTVNFANVGAINVGVNTQTNGGATGTWDMSSATILGGVLTADSMSIGIGHDGVGTATFGSSLTNMNLRGSLRIGVQPTGSTGVPISGVLNLAAGTNLAIGTAGASDLQIGLKLASQPVITGSLVMSGGSFTGNLASVYVGANNGSLNGGANGTLDLSTTTIVGGTLTMDKLQIGVGPQGHGTVTFNSTLTNLNIRGELLIGARGEEVSGTTGVLNLASGTSVAVGTNGNSDLLIGEKISSQGVTSGGLTVASANFSANLARLRVGVNDFANGSSTGSLNLSTATIVGGSLAMDLLDVGVGTSANGTISFNTSLDNLTIRNGLRIGAQGLGASGTVGTLTLASGTNVSIGTVTASSLLIGEKIGSAGNISGSLTVDQGNFIGHFTTVRVGTNTFNGQSSTGTLNLSTANLLETITMSSLTIGTGANATGTVRLPTGLSTVSGNVVVGDSNVSPNVGGSGLLELDGNLMTVTGSVLIDVSGDVAVNVQEMSAGLVLTDSSISALTINTGATLSINFEEDPLPNIFGPVYGLAWAGDHVAALSALTGTKLLLNTSGLSPGYASQVGVFLQGGVTYVGFIAVGVPEPASLWLVSLGLLALRKRKQGSKLA